MRSSIQKETIPRSYEQQVHDPYFNHYAPFYSNNVYDLFGRDKGWNYNFHEFYDENTSKLPSNQLPAKLMKIQHKEAIEAHFFRCQLYGYNERHVKIQVDDKVLTISGRKRYRKFSTSFQLPENSMPNSFQKSMNRMGVVTITVPKMEIGRINHGHQLININ
ncbi:17.5 kDa class I heat shock protein-like [Solanum stenotomum]|uniref:17.5 kDa class I heat shock protein-like n=1 Tax=Solanum stenotomum TaxID=172797 RepID=UPI0020D1B698|nr:17.5 kDa class I heat shock protein-like [Solanum stenotomum]